MRRNPSIGANTMINQPANARRFEVIETGVIVAIFDSCRSFTTYAPVDGDNTVDVAAARTYFDDELREI